MSSDAPTKQLAGGKLLVDEPADGVVRLTIANPAKRNALDHPILDAIAATLAELAAEANAAEGASDPTHPHCVILTGSGGMFSAGYDISEIPDEEFEQRAEALVAHPFTEAIDALESFPYPTLAALPGHTIGGGLELALACDLRIARDGIKLGMPPAKLGLVYSHTGLRRFIDAIGAARTRELFLLGRYVDAQTALAWGLVNRVVAADPDAADPNAADPDAADPNAAEGDRDTRDGTEGGRDTAEDRLDAASIELAAELAGNAPLSQTGNKRVIAALLDARDGLDAEVEAELIELRRASFASQDMREGMRAFAEKRPARWQGR